MLGISVIFIEKKNDNGTYLSKIRKGKSIF